MRTALEQELGLAAYFVSSEAPLEKGARSEALESDAEKLSSTDNEDEELVTEGGEGRSRHLSRTQRGPGPVCWSVAPDESHRDMSLGEIPQRFQTLLSPPHFW